MASQAPNDEPFSAATWVKPPNYIRNVSALVILTPWSVVLPKHEISGQSDFTRISNFVSKLGRRDYSNLVTTGTGSKAVLEIYKVHEEISPRHPYFLHHVAAHHTPRTNDYIGEPDRLPE